MELFLQGLNASHNISMLTNATWNYTSDQVTEVNLIDILGPKRSPFFLPVTIVYLLIFLVGLSGNLLTCAVIAKHKKMRNPTNLYLVSLAMSDLLVLLFGMPLEIYDLWQNYPFPFGEAGCYFKTFLFETVCFASILNVTALSVESILYLVMGLHLGREKRQPSRNFGKNSGSFTRKKNSVMGRRRQVNKMLSIVVAVFGICWAPFHIERLLWSSISQWTDLMHNIYQYVHILSGVFFYLSSAANPIIYSLLSTRFRECFRELVCSQAEDSSSVRDSPPFPKILLDADPVSSSRSQIDGKHSNAVIPLLSPDMTLSMDSTILTCACDETTCRTSVF
ncbi:neuromedin-U receptor 2 [Xyrichtys novacula]|uniref:Neuromedin-U receptor 2 n=1 Tax=Xyrichtys novacula TaxID=13765 RepID=A0AAV1EQC1_XYRNO|nr:neuromedin-U receptor 2 [Xyrichtys novacula]